MDLHDFTDVAQNYDCYLAELLGDSCEGFEAFYLSLAEEYGGAGILDIACGTGALTVPLAQAGFDVTASDLSAPMIDAVRRKLLDKNLQAQTFAANMESFTCDRKFSLAIIARSGFMHLLTAAAQRQTLLNIRKHLTDGGVLTLNHFQPHPAIQARQMQAAPKEYNFRTVYTNSDGLKERILEANTYDYTTQVMRGSWKFETLDAAGNVAATRERPLAIRHIYRQEMAYLFELCGFEVLAVYNDYLRSEATDNFIWVVKKM